MTICKNCGSAIKWFRDTENNKWIPLESNSSSIRGLSKGKQISLRTYSLWQFHLIDVVG